MISGERKEQRSFEKWVGWFEGEVVAINPSKEEIEKLTGNTLNKEITYNSEDADGNPMVRVTAWMRDVKKDLLFQVNFRITDKICVSKTGKTQYINQTGITTYVDSKENLPEWFTHFVSKEKVIIGKKTYREALQGESGLYDFLSSWLQINLFHPDSNIFLDIKRLFKGDFKELQDLIGSDFTKVITKAGEKPATVVALATISTKEDEEKGTINEYQQVYSRQFLPGYYAKSLRLGGNLPKAAAKFIENIKNEEYGCKEYYVLSELQPYDSSKNVAASSSVVHTAEVEDDGSRW